MEVDRHGVVTGGLDRVGDDHATTIDGLVQLFLHCVSDLSGRNGTEEASVCTDLAVHGHNRGLQGVAHEACIVDGSDLTTAASCCHLIDLCLCTLGPLGGEATGNQVVTGVSRLDLDDIACGTETFHIVGEDELGSCHFSVLPFESAAGRGVGQQSHLSRILDGASNATLLLDGDTGDAASADLATVRDELTQQSGVLVVDRFDLGRLQRVGLLLNGLIAKLRLRHDVLLDDLSE